MKGRVVMVESGTGFNDGERRITIRLNDADMMFDRVRLRESALGLRDVRLDMELDVEIENAIVTMARAESAS